MRRALAAAAALVLLAAGSAPTPDARERAYRANNRGVALLEQFKAQDAVSAFREALTLAPDLPLARVNLAIALLNAPDLPGADQAARAALAAQPDSLQAQFVLGIASRGLDHADDAKAAFRAVLARDPDDVGAQVNLGQMLMAERAYPDAVAAFRAALSTQPYNATAAYNLGLALTRSGQAEEGAAMLERFRTLRDSGAATLIGQAYPEQGRYAEAQASTGAEADLVDAATPAARFTDATPTMLPSPAPAGPGNPLLFDADGDGDLDLFDVTTAGQRAFRNDGGRFTDATAALGLDPVRRGIGAIAGDVDADGKADLVVIGESGVWLYKNDGKFRDVTAAAGLAKAGRSLAAALADVDHDGDLDLVLGAHAAGSRLFQNTGAAVFHDVAEKAGLTAKGSVGAIVPTDYDNGRDLDLVETVALQEPRLLRNRRDGTFEDVAQKAGLASADSAMVAAVGDVDKDGYPDLFFGRWAGDVLARGDGHGGFQAAPFPGGSKDTRAAMVLDYDNDGLLDLLAFGAAGGRVFRNLGSRWQDATAAALGPLAKETVAAVAAGDLDGDGDTDLVVRLEQGALRVLRNDGGTNASIRVALTGRVSNRSGVGAKLEMRAGALKQKLETYATLPAAAPADVVFGLGKRKTADAVRVIWPSGILQTEILAETPQTARLAVEELDRKPSSCPYLYAWNGRAFEFVTDFMGGGEMGYQMAPGVFNQPDPLEYVRLDDRQLRARDGRYELRVTNELEEALFVDRLSLLAVAHPADVEVHPFEGMTDPPKPARFYAVRGARPVVSARDERGRDVTADVRAMDRRFADVFTRQRIRGYADPHTLTLDLGRVPDRAALLLTGWTDYAFSSDNVAAHQARLAMHPPSLEVEDASGRWVTAVEQIGIPVGRPQTVLVDLTGVWKGPSRRVRLSGSMRVLWNQIRVAALADEPQPPVVLEAARADLRERGFSAEVSSDGREPYGYDYARVSLVSPWKAFPGRYTRTGDVRELLTQADDAFVTSKPGDEIALSFDASALP
ncbi:MAG: FG-GAP-like repeat-containing protein, partial [Vicinamibacteria bacterium]